MNQQKIIPILLFALLLSFSANAQFGQSTQARGTNHNFETNLASNNMMRSRDVLQEVINQGKNNQITIADVEGEPYFQTFFVSGNLMYKDSLNLGEFPMRYNAYADEMEVSNPDGNNVINKADYLSILIGKDKYVPLNYMGDTDKIEKGFFIEKAEGQSASLYLRKFKTIKQGMDAKTSFHKETPPSFVDNEAYFMKFGTNPIMEIKLKKNRILKSFPDKNDILKKYVSDKKLNIETEAGLVALVAHYNSLN